MVLTHMNFFHHISIIFDISSVTFLEVATVLMYFHKLLADLRYGEVSEGNTEISYKSVNVESKMAQQIFPETTFSTLGSWETKNPKTKFCMIKILSRH